MKLNLLTPSAALALALLTSRTLAAEPETVWISSLDLSPITQGWGQPQADKAVTGKPLSIGGKTFERGLGTHTDSLVRLQLKGGAERFMASVGVDDAATSDQATIVFRVVGDGKTLWKSPGMKRGQAARPVEVDVKGVKMLLLLADSGGDISFGHADWADAKLLVTGERPVIVGQPREEAVILTPKPPRTPRINGARIFGVHPGHPFLFTIPATGDRPMTFAVDHLPKGLTVDASTGQIQGRIEKPGEYVGDVPGRQPARQGAAQVQDRLRRDPGPHAAHGLEQLVCVGGPRDRQDHARRRRRDGQQRHDQSRLPIREH